MRNCSATTESDLSDPRAGLVQSKIVWINAPVCREVR
jgi:hypothetical protein